MMIDQAVRFGAVISQSEFRSEPLLEVGSGLSGIAAFVDNQVFGVDVRFNGNVTKFIPIRASATSLPLRDGCFRQVVCSGMLEHVNPGDRSGAIKELVRVTEKTLFLICPCGIVARKADVILAWLYWFLYIPLPDWLEEHLANPFPSALEIVSILEERGFTVRKVTLESVFTHLIISILIGLKRLNAFWRLIFTNKPDRIKRISSFLRHFAIGNPYLWLWVAKK
jgi:hypothetical protein